MTTFNWEEIAQKETPQIFKDFYSPLIPAEVTLEENLEDAKCDTAFFDFHTNRTSISKKFLERLCLEGRLEPEIAFGGILKHEVGHYSYYPRECSTLMFFGHLAESNFKEYADGVLAYWCDLMNNLTQVLMKHKGKDVRAVYRGLARLMEQDKLSAVEQAVFKLLKIAPEEVQRTMRDYSVDKLLIAYYQRQGNEDLGVRLEKDGYLAQKFKEMMSINYLTKEDEIVNFIQFGNIVADILKQRDAKLPKLKIKVRYGGSGEDGELWKILRRFIKPIFEDAPELKDFPKDKLEEGLNDIIRKWGKSRYERIKDYVERKTGKEFDKPRGTSRGQSHSQQAGTEEGIQLQFHDGQIPYYERLAGTYGVSIFKKPLMVDVTDNYPEGKKEFTIGDPIRTLDPFSTGGIILPGITKRHQLKAGKRKDRLYKVPDAWLRLDTSGSMKHPTKGSLAVLCSSILANGYWHNGASIGVDNFSVDMATLFPTRDLNAVYSLLCAYWGGGTWLNINKIKKHLQKLAATPEDARQLDIIYTTEDDYKKYAASLPPEEQKEFMEKNLEVKMTRQLKETYDKIDNILITDGWLANPEEVIDHFNSVAQLTRNFVFITGSPKNYERWKKLNLPNTEVYPADKKEDFIGLTLGIIDSLAPPDNKPVSLFYQ
ncbi:hypothetical protein HZC30_02460 [Candidatus Woesearchaeota archaeon]|nr:hypothetical protein [Candidatus Woesearchaeota archaeon]